MGLKPRPSGRLLVRILPSKAISRTACYNVRQGKAHSYRFYLTWEQDNLLRRTLGCVRLVYNKALHERTQGWYERQERKC